jgi:hypothetical protein
MSRAAGSPVKPGPSEDDTVGNPGWHDAVDEGQKYSWGLR